MNQLLQTLRETYLESGESAANDIILRYANQIEKNTIGKTYNHYGSTDYQHDKYSGKSGYLSTGYDEIDRYAKIKRSNITTIAAASHHGKTLVSHNMAFNIWRKEQLEGKKKTKIAIIKYEDTNYDTHLHMNYLYYNYLLLYGLIKNKAYWNMEFKDYCEQAQTKETKIALLDDDIHKTISEHFIVQDSNFSAEILDIVIEKIIDRNPELTLIFIDYLQLVETDETKGSRHRDVKHILARLLDIAKRYNIAIIIAAQLGMDTKNKTKEAICRPSNVFEAKAIYHATDLFLTVWNQTIFDITELGEDIDDSVQQMTIDIKKARRQNLKNNIPFSAHKKYGMVIPVK